MKFTPTLIHPWKVPEDTFFFWDVRFFMEQGFLVFILVLWGFGFALALGETHPKDGISAL